MNDPSEPLTLLNWHQFRREQGVPTVSVLIGSSGIGTRELRRWATNNSLKIAQIHADTLKAVAEAWLVEVTNTVNLVALAQQWLNRLDSNIQSPQSRFDLDELWRTVIFNPAEPNSDLVYLLLLTTVEALPINPLQLARELAIEQGLSQPDFLQVFIATCGLIPPKQWPVLMLIEPDNNDTVEACIRMAIICEKIAETVPALPLAICLSQRVYASTIEASGHSRAVTLLRQGIIPVPAVSDRELIEQLTAHGVVPLPTLATIQRLAEDGIAPDVAVSFVEVAKAIRESKADDLASDFRSVHERFLFEQLESMPETAGLFRPNHTLGFRHGTTWAEGDLVAEGLKLAIEIDGEYYHLNASQFRRDRKKDWLYQQHGYIVLRFLAEDVVDNLAPMFNTILEAVALRRSATFPPEVTTGE